MCSTVNSNLTVSNMLITGVYQKFQAMYVERLMKWGKRGLEEEENVIDLEDREKLMKKDIQGL